MNPQVEEYLRKRKDSNKEPLVKFSDKEKEELSKQKEERKSNIENGEAEPEIEEPPYFLQSIVFTIPFTLLYGWLYYLVYFQYSMLDELTYKELFMATVKIIPAFMFICYIVRRYKKYTITHIILGISGSVAATYALNCIFIDERFGAMLKTPGLIILCIYAVMETHISIAILLLIPPIVYYLNDGFRTKLTNIDKE